MFRKLRILILLIVLVNVGVGAWLTRVRTTSWTSPVRVAVFPIPADDSPATRDYLDTLTRETFAPIETFFREDAKHYGIALTSPVDVALARRLDVRPPVPPFGGSRMEIVLWSLDMRAWVWRHGDVDGPRPHVRIFVLFHDPRLRVSVPHSVGLPQGLIGVVHAFATRHQAAQNNVVIAHELLHTLGAKDKYDPETNQPIFPDGFADPGRSPRYPQEYAEIMAGRRPVSPSHAEMPVSLDEALIGPKTAQEIGWTP
ncbi:MAG: hypothetical protein GC151_02830 [Betaproteobacteria bacterium]|nr:hypothetical protein [Betaproteobacteria bacterium]